MENIDLKYVRAEIDATIKLMQAWNEQHKDKAQLCIPSAIIDRLNNLQKYLPAEEKTTEPSSLYNVKSSKKTEKKGEQ